MSCGGRVCKVDQAPEDILSYLLARDNTSLADRFDLFAQPTELGAVLLRTARLLDLDDEVDPELVELDYISVNGFLPDSFDEFSCRVIEGGTNATFMIGRDIWTIKELEQAWPETVLPTHVGQALASIISSLLFPDRTAWFLLPRAPSAALKEPGDTSLA